MNVATSMDVSVRIGGLEVAAAGDDVRLVTVGLGSCVGVAVIDTRSGAVGLAHVFLPEAPPSGAKPGAGAGTYAATAVPELVRRVARAGGPQRTQRLVAVLVGGATMFGGGRPGQDIGERNVAAVTAALTAAGVPVVASEVGGTHGRTMYVHGGDAADVRVRQVGGAEQVTWSIGPPMRAGATLEQRRAA
ncbi:MAG: CheD, stimulates methylation of protein [Thermoleophilia bacterium]|nr:CheD, stimulates methylation of protein [Thermoleophilia bacterium]